MAALDIQKYTGVVISTVICIILVVTVGLPIIQTALNSDALSGSTAIANAGAISALIEVVPLLLVVGVILGVIGVALYNRKN